MKKIAFLLFFLTIVVFGAHFLSRTPDTFGQRFLEDADTARIEHLLYWSGLIEEYHDKTGQYPMQDWIQPGESVRLVRILNPGQRVYITKTSDKYNAAADINPHGDMPEASMKDFIATLEAGLKRYIDEKYDVQQIPRNSPIGYYYSVTPDGYVLWGVCLRCGVTPVTVLLADGHTPAINIASKSMVAKVEKAQTREDMIANPLFLKLASRPYHKEGFVRMVERKHMHDTKQADVKDDQ